MKSNLGFDDRIKAEHPVSNTSLKAEYIEKQQTQSTYYFIELRPNWTLALWVEPECANPVTLNEDSLDARKDKQGGNWATHKLLNTSIICLMASLHLIDVWWIIYQDPRMLIILCWGYRKPDIQCTLHFFQINVGFSQGFKTDHSHKTT